MDNLELALRLGLALALGFVIGFERGWQEREGEEGSRTAGLRTFSLIGLLGGMFGILSLGGDRILLATGFLVTGGTLAVFMWREGERDKDLSVTSLVAALITFMLGVLAVLGDMSIAAGAGIATTIILAYKGALHGFLARISWTELHSGLLLAAMTFIALPLLPNRAIDPWGALNPHELWLMTILIAAVSFAGYAAVKIVGPQRGLVLAAALGGLFASTAVTLSMARLAAENTGRLRLLAGAILAAGGVMMVRVLVVTGLLNMELALTLAPILLAAAAIQGLAAAALIISEHKDGQGEQSAFAHKNPFLLSEVLRFGALLAAVIFASHFALRHFGGQGLLTVAAISGLADVDAMTLSASRMTGAGATAAYAILTAVTVNTVAKSIYAWQAGGARLGSILLAANAMTVAGGTAALVLLSSVLSGAT